MIFCELNCNISMRFYQYTLLSTFIMNSSEARHIVRTTRDTATGIITLESWINEAGYGDRSGGPAVIWRDAATGTVTREVWYQNGKRHRPDGPAVTWRDVDGTVTRREWFMNGRRANRMGGAAVIHPPAGTPRYL